MNTHSDVEHDEVVDRRRPVDRYLGNYAEDHRNEINQRVHWVCVPLIVWSVIAALWTIPVAPQLGRPGLWAGLAMAAAIGWYFRLSRVLAIAIFVAFVVFSAINYLLYEKFGAQGLLTLAIVVFVVAWIGQFIGHKVEGRRPSFLTDLVYLLVGPMWTMSKLLRKLGIPY